MADLLHRLILKRCIYGVDLSPMGAEVARLSLWLAAFVPGLSLAYLGHNVQSGDSLVGVADQAGPDAARRTGSPSLDTSAVEEAVAAAAGSGGTRGDRGPDTRGVGAQPGCGPQIRQATDGSPSAL